MDGKKKSIEITALPRHIGKLMEEKTARTAPREAVRGLGLALAAFLLGNCALPFVTYPLGIAFLCASSEGTLYIAAGLMAASFTLPLPWGLTLTVVLGVLLIRILARVFIDLPSRIGKEQPRSTLWEHLHGRLFCEALYLRMACACVAVFAMSLYAIIRGGFRYYDLFGAIFSIVAAPIAVFLFSGLFSGGYRLLFEGRLATVTEHLSHIALAVALCYSLVDATLAGIPLAPAFAFVAVLVLCRRRGVGTSLTAGVILGAVLSPSYILIFPVCTVAAYCIFDTSPMLAASVSCIAGTVCGTVMTGSGAVSGVFLPLFAGTAVYCTAEKLLRRVEPEPKVPCPPTESYFLAQKQEKQTAAAHRLAQTMDELSEALTALSKQQKKPSAADLRILCDSCFDRLCPDCTSRADCWESRYHIMLDSLNELTAEVAEKGSVTVETLPPTLLRGCVAADRLVTLINEGAADLSRSLFCSEKTEIFARDYAASAALLRGICQVCDEDFREDEKTAAAVSSRMKDLGFAASSVKVMGARQKTVAIAGMSTLPEKSRLGYIAGQLERVCGFPLISPQLGSDGVLTLRRGSVVNVTYGSGFSAREGVCGDVVTFFRDDSRGVLFALLNDGMGAGKEAAFTAKLASLFLRKLLPSGVAPETALRMLNHFLRRGRNVGSAESSTTVDLLMLDLILGRAVFLKSGAAPTYVKRGKNIFYLDAKTVPVGILGEIDAKQIDFEVTEGDIIVMVSDGITDGDGQCLWLLDCLDNTEEKDPTVLAEHIVRSAAERGNADDLSAIVLVVGGAF